MPSPAPTNPDRLVKKLKGHLATAPSLGAMLGNEATPTGRTVGGQSGAAQKTGEAVQIIRAIASQANLLALNATMETARAREVQVAADRLSSQAGHLSRQVGSFLEAIRLA